MVMISTIFAADIVLRIGVVNEIKVSSFAELFLIFFIKNASQYRKFIQFLRFYEVLRGRLQNIKDVSPTQLEKRTEINR